MGLSTRHLEAWENVRSTLKSDFGDATFSSWIAPLKINSVEKGQVTIAAPNRYLCDRVQTNYGAKIRDAWREKDPTISRVAYRVVDIAPTDAEEAVGDVEAELGVARPKSGGGEVESIPLDTRFTFEKFVVGRPNEFAYSAARRVAEDAGTPFSPLFVYGNPGLGKTHLLHAIAWRRKELFPDQRIMFISAETFLVEFLSALQSQRMRAFKDSLRNVDMLIIDDVHWIFGKTRTQEEFFHTFNALCERQRQIVLSAEHGPTELHGLSDRLRSRLGWGLVADLHPTDVELRRGILEKKAEAAIERTPGLKIDPKVLDFLANRVLSDVRTLEGALNKLFAIATMAGCPVTIEMAQRELQELLRHSDRKVSVEEIQRKVADHFDIRLCDMTSKRRMRAVARPRQVAMYLAKQLTQKSLPEIGQRFGNRDHTTVMHAIKRITALRETDSAFDDDVELLRRALEG